MSDNESFLLEDYDGEECDDEEGLFNPLDAINREFLDTCLEKIDITKHKNLEYTLSYIELLQELDSPHRKREEIDILWDIVRVCKDNVDNLKRCLSYTMYFIDYYSELL